MKRALVLSGGAMVGLAWQTGVAAGLEEAGVDLRDADMIFGTAAGASLGWRLACGRAATTLAAAICIEENAAPSPAASSRTAPPSGLPDLLWRQFEAELAGGDATSLRREIGAMSLDAKTVDEATYLERTDQMLPIGRGQPWPAKFACSAVDAGTGELVAWRASSAVGLAEAVGSSCSVPISSPAVTIKARRYISGAMRSVSNADLAAGYDHVLVIAMRPPPSDPRTTERMQRSLAFETDRLREGGAVVDVVQPDDASMAAIGFELANVLDLRRRPAACKAGMAQGRALAAALKPYWD